jgi:hypothetical protein
MFCGNMFHFVDRGRPLTGAHGSSAVHSALREETEVHLDWCVESAERGAVADVSKF